MQKSKLVVNSIFNWCVEDSPSFDGIRYELKPWKALLEKAAHP